MIWDVISLLPARTNGCFIREVQVLSGGRDEAWEALDPIIPNFGPSTGVGIGVLPVDTPLITPGNFFTPGGFHSFEHCRAPAEAFRFHLDIGKARVQDRIHSLNTMTKEALAEMPHV